MSGLRRRRGERGAVLVETALGLPILLLFMFGLVDAGMWTLNVNQATNAARDGARTGIISYELADVPGSGDWTAILESIEDHLNRDLTASNLTVSCVDDGGLAIAGGCAFAEPGDDRVRVQVTWDWDLITPLAGVIGRPTGASTGTATMEIIGLPGAESGAVATTTSTTTSTTTTTTTVAGPTSSTTTTAPTGPTTTAQACSVDSFSMSQDPVRARTNKRLYNDLVIQMTTSGICNDISFAVTAPRDSTVVETCGCGGGPTWTWTIPQNSSIDWRAGEGILELINDGFVMVEHRFDVET